MAAPESNDAPASRSWLPSPGCLFALILLVALASACAWVGWRAQRQQARLEYFERIGGSMQTKPAEPPWLRDLVITILGDKHAAGFTDITAINLNRHRFGDEGLRPLHDLHQLEWFNLEHAQFTDNELQHLSGLTNLKHLYLNNTQMTDAGLQHLSGLTNLERLKLQDTRVTDVGADELRSQLPGVNITH